LPPLPGLDDRAGDSDQQQCREQGISHCGARKRRVITAKDQNASRCPQQQQEQQRHSLQRRQAGPVAHGRQQKTRNDRNGIAVDHFMAMPDGGG
jgi:hypothetical protein